VEEEQPTVFVPTDDVAGVEPAALIFLAEASGFV
jgi:hypothetical protein